jgi:DNA-binding IclR family transcriptional regulator
VKALSNALAVLDAFSSNRGRWSVKDLCDRTGFKKSQVSKVLGAFREAGLLRQDEETREYSVGLRAVALAANYLNAQPLVHESIGHMRRLANQVEHTVVLSVLDEDKVMYLLGVEGPHFLDVGSRVGTWLPFHATAVGKVLFAFASADPAFKIPNGELKRFTRNTVTDRKALAAQFGRIRKDGVASTTGETADGLAAQAVPIIGRGGKTIAALGFVYPLHLVTPKKRESYTDLLHDAARQISTRLGADVYPFGRR